jgi:hypothetical protein
MMLLSAGRILYLRILAAFSVAESGLSGSFRKHHLSGNSGMPAFRSPEFVATRCAGSLTLKPIPACTMQKGQ